MIAIHIPKLEYQTISYTRRLSADMPFADYRHGVPYGQKNGPAIAIAGAFASISTGMAAITAAGGLLTAGGLLGGLMVVGGIASGLGGLTGNAALSNFGMIAGLAGGAVGGFVSADTGAFFNPFTDPSGFGGSVTGTALKSVFSDIKSGLGITENPVAAEIKANAGVTGSIEEEILSGKSSLNNFNGESVTSFKTPTASAGTGATSGGGLLSTLNNNQGLVSALGGLGNGFIEQQKLEQLQPLRDAQVAGTNANTAGQLQQNDIIAQRQENLQFQPNTALKVNQNQDIYNRTPGDGNAGKYAVAINGTIKYVTQAEYDAMRQAQGGTGMLAQQGVA
jgi:hypothetical protein